MPKSIMPPPYDAVREVLNHFPLRYIEEHTAIGKNRLHSLRQAPFDIRLRELNRLMNARFLRVRIDNPYGVARRTATERTPNK